MAIRVICACGARLKARDEAVGKRLRCPTCQASVAVPSNSELPATRGSEPEPALLPIEITIAPSLSSTVSAKKSPGKWLPLAAIGVTAIAVGAFLMFNRGEPHQATTPVANTVAAPAKPVGKPSKGETHQSAPPDAVAAPAKPVGKPTKNPTEVSPARVNDDRVRSLLTKADLAYAEDEA